MGRHHLEAVANLEQATGVLAVQPESRVTLEQAFNIRLELRTALNLLGDGRRMLQCLREGEALAERLNDDRRRGRVCAFLTNTHSMLGELDAALASGGRAMDIVHRLGDVDLRTVNACYLVQAHFLRGDYERTVELAIGNIAALPIDRMDDFFGMGVLPAVWDRS